MRSEKKYMNTAYTSHPEAIGRKGCQTVEVGRTINLAASNLTESLLTCRKLTPELHLEKWLKNEMRKWKI